jgi:serine protease Do
MIRRTLKATKDATFSIMIPDLQPGRMSLASGTGFFVSHDGWFVTAAHVVCDTSQAGWPLRSNIRDLYLEKDSAFMAPPIGCHYGISVSHVDRDLDIAFLRVDFAANAAATWLQGRTGFPFIEITVAQVEEGEPVYSFGYPLPEMQDLSAPGSSVIAAGFRLSPRVTSAIVASTIFQVGPVRTNADPIRYVIDKALNYGNSGGPIVEIDNGRVFAVCTMFQPVEIRQSHIQGNPLIRIPSLYGVVSSLSDQRIKRYLSDEGIPHHKP